MKSHGVIFDARKSFYKKTQDRIIDFLSTYSQRGIGVGLFIVSIIVLCSVFYLATHTKKVSAIEPAPNEAQSVIVQEKIKPASAEAATSASIPIESALPPSPQPFPSYRVSQPAPIQQAKTPLPAPQKVIHTAAVQSLRMPLAAYRSISTYFSSYHPGVDLTDPTGTPVMAAADGIVTHAAWSSDGYGMSVVLDHHNGLMTRYAHLSTIIVAPGQSVAAGEVIGAVGCTGNCTGSHLHFEVRVGGVAHNPFAYLSH